MVVAVHHADLPVIRLAADPLAQVDPEGRGEAALMDAILPHQFMYSTMAMSLILDDKRGNSSFTRGDTPSQKAYSLRQ